MTLLDYQIKFGDSGLLIGPGTDVTVVNIEGLDRTIRDADDDRPNADGAVLGPDYADKRTVIITMRIRKDTPSDAMQVYETLAAAWNQCRGSEGAQTTVSMRWKLPWQVARRLEGGRPRRLGLDLSTIASGKLTVIGTYVAPDPRILADAQQVLTLPYGGTATTLPNAGNHPAAVVWDVGGVVTNPGVIRNETDRFDLTGTVATTTFHRVRTDPKTVTRSSDSANMYSEFSGTWLEIPAGGGGFRAVGSGYGSAQVTATYRDTWL